MTGLLASKPKGDPQMAPLLNHDFYYRWTQFLLTLQHRIRGAKALTIDTAFKDVEDFLFGSGFMKAFLPSWLTHDLVVKPGAVAEVVKKFRDRLGREMEKIRKGVESFKKLKADERKRKAEEEINRIGHAEALLRKKQLEREKVEMLKQLERIGVSTEGLMKKKYDSTAEDEENEEDDDDNGYEEDMSRLGAVRKLREKNFKTQMRLLEAYGVIANTVAGPHSIHITSGRYRLYLHMVGIDLWDVFPIPAAAPPSKKKK